MGSLNLKEFKCKLRKDEWSDDNVICDIVVVKDTSGIISTTVLLPLSVDIYIVELANCGISSIRFSFIKSSNMIFKFTLSIFGLKNFFTPSNKILSVAPSSRFAIAPKIKRCSSLSLVF